MNKTTFYSTGIFKGDDSKYKWWLLVVMMLGTFMAVLDSTIVNVALPTITHHYNSTIEQSQWVVSGYLISMAVMLLCSHWFAERFGYKIVYLIGISIFTLGSWLCSIAPSLEFLIGARFFEGIGSGIIQPLALAMILNQFDSSKRGLALGFWAMSSGAAVSLGPFLGGYLIQFYNWSSIFVINIPIGLISMIGIFLIVKNMIGDRKVSFDFFGFLLMLIWIPLFLYSMVELGNNHSDHTNTFLLLYISLIIFVLFIIRELRCKDPLINLRLFKNRTFTISMIVTFFYGIALLGGNYILPEYLQHSLGYSVFESGIVFLPVGIIQMVMSPISGALIKKLGDRILIYSGLLVILSYILISVGFDSNTPKWLIMFSLYLRGLGIGLSFTALSHLSFSQLQSSDMGEASGISNTIRQFAGSISVAVLTAILVFNSHLISDLSPSQTYLNGIKIDFIIMLIAIILSIIPLFFLIKEKKE